MLNSTKTAYSAFVFEADGFFESYSFGRVRNGSSSRTAHPDKFSCQVLIKVGTYVLSSLVFGLTYHRPSYRPLKERRVDVTRTLLSNGARLSSRKTLMKPNADSSLD